MLRSVEVPSNPISAYWGKSQINSPTGRPDVSPVLLNRLRRHALLSTSSCTKVYIFVLFNEGSKVSFVGWK